MFARQVLYYLRHTPSPKKGTFEKSCKEGSETQVEKRKNTFTEPGK
jgi:hypothetical protein